jgi:hypothetical protein
MPAWLLPLLRVIGLRKVQTDAVGAALELAREIEVTIETAGDDPPPPPRPRKGPQG